MHNGNRFMSNNNNNIIIIITDLYSAFRSEDTEALGSSSLGVCPVCVPGTVVIELSQFVSWPDGVKGDFKPGLVRFCWV